MTHFYKSLFFLFLLSCCLLPEAKAQQKFLIRFNEKGQIIDSLPSLVTTKDQVRFEVVSSKESTDKSILDAYLNYIQYLKNVDARDKKDKNAYKLLEDAGLKSEGIQLTLLVTLRAEIAQVLLDFLNDPVNAKVIQSERSVSDDRALLNKFVGDSTLPDKDKRTHFYIPPVSGFVGNAYMVRYGFKKGYNPNENWYPCPDSINLIPYKGQCCLFKSLATPDDYENFQTYKFKTAFTNAFKLRLPNKNLLAYNLQVDALQKAKAFLTGIDYETFTKLITDGFATLSSHDTDYNNLKGWLLAKYTGSMDLASFDKTVKIIKPEKIKAVTDAITTISGNMLKSEGPDKTLAFLFAISWMNQGKSLTANPVSPGTKPDIKDESDKLTAQIKVLTQQESELNDRLGFVQNASKATTVACCDLKVLDGIDKRYQKFQAQKDTIDKNVTALQKQLDELNKKPGVFTKNQLYLEHQFLRDSLLYAGTLVVNPWQDSVCHPNLPGYNYVRNHNILNDANHFDLHKVPRINELQQMKLLAINAAKDAKYTLTTTYSDLTTLDFFSQDLDFASNKAVNNPGKAEVDATSLNGLYASYQQMMKYADLFKNNVIATHLQEKEDSTADYVTRPIAHGESDVPGKLTTYTVKDPATGKNVNSEGLTFSYGYDRLMRFGFKAGIAYSWLSRRTYTINTTANTATYTDSYAGLAPAIGVQVFFDKLDMQSQRFLPDSYHPFFYVGYMFHDTPANNFLFGGGLELISGVSAIVGAHLGKTQGLTLEQGNLLEKDHYKFAPFVSLSVGIEAFKTIFSSSTLTDPLK